MRCNTSTATLAAKRRLTTNHHKPTNQLTQESIIQDERWEVEVLPRLPANWEEQAKINKAFQRKREIARASILLRAVLAYVLGVMSVREWSAWAVLVGLANISEAAWRKRLRTSSAWLFWVFCQLVSVPPPACTLGTNAPVRVLLVDATRLHHPGGTGDDWRLHLSYDLCAGRFAEVRLTDWGGGEQLDYYHLRPGDIVVADGGYGIRRNLSIILKQQANGILRIHPSTLPVVDACGQKIDLFAWIRATDSVQVEQKVFFRDGEGQLHAVRIVAHALPPEKAELSRMRRRKEAQKHGCTISDDTLLIAGWLIVVTTLPADAWPAADILRLYRARWQIELVFKRMKQILHLNQLRSKILVTVEACVRALLLAWVLQEQEVAYVRSVLNQLAQANDCILSTWSITQLSLETLRQQVLGSWSQKRLELCLPLLTRFLSSSNKRNRDHQETSIRLWLGGFGCLSA
jgi:hypothetical protein